MKRSLINLIYYESSVPTHIYGSDKHFRIADSVSLEARYNGEDMPANAMTMVGMKRLNNIQELIEDIQAGGIEGDFLEAGSCKGGCTILMRALLRSSEDTSRRVFVCDTFADEAPTSSWLVHTIFTTVTWLLASIPIRCWKRRLVNFVWQFQNDFPSTDREVGEDEEYIMLEFLRSAMLLRPTPSVSKGMDCVRSNFARYGLLDEQVVFLQGWFSETIPNAQMTDSSAQARRGHL